MTNPIAYYVEQFGGNLIIKTSGESVITQNYHEALSFLLKGTKADYSVPRVVWNLAEFVNLLKEYLPEFAVTELESDHHRADWYEKDIHIRLYYQSGKFFGLHYGGFGEETTFYELDQYFPGDYEITGVKGVQAKADELAEALHSLGITKIDKLNSPVTAVESATIVQQAYRALPDPKAIPDGVKEYAQLSDTWGAWQAAYQVGYWPAGQNFSYDIASCYPSVARNLFSLQGAEYKYSRKMLDNANYAFLKGTMYINPDSPLAWCSPIISDVDDVVTNPVGQIKGVFTLGQVKYIERHNIGNFRLYDGWFIYLNSKERPLAPVMESLFKRRQQSELMSMLCKRIIAGIIGKLGQYIDDKPTELTNPVYHSIIRNYAPLKVAEFLIQHDIQQNELIHVNTDGFHCTRDIGLSQQSDIGQWRESVSEDLIVLSSDYILEGEKCQPLIEAIKKDGKAYRYDDLNLIYMAGDQDRYFPDYPTSGKELLSKRYNSEPLVR